MNSSPSLTNHSFRFGRARTYVVIVLFICLPHVKLSAQLGSITVSVQELAATIQDAYIDFKAGNGTTGLAKLETAVRIGPLEPHQDLQRGRLLLAISCAFKNRGDRTFLYTTSLLLSRIAAPEGRMNAADAAASLMLAGDVFEMRNELDAAKQAYQRAVALDSSLQHAANRLARIKAVEERAKEKEGANALLRARALQRQNHK